MSDTGFDRQIEGRNIQHVWGAEVLLEAYIRNQGVAVTGVQPYVTVYRHSDEYVLDYISDTFVPLSNVGYPYNVNIFIPMTEYTNGLYHYFFEQSKYVDPRSLATGTLDGDPVNEAYSLVYIANYTIDGKQYKGSDYELHLFGTGLYRYLRVLYDQHRRLLHKHSQFDNNNMEKYEFCTI